MKKREPIAKIMSTEIITLNIKDDLYKAEKLFKENNIRHIPVISGSEIIGMLSKTDLLRISFADEIDDSNIETVVYNMFTIEQVMVKNLVTISSKSTIEQTAQILVEKDFHALPVVDDNKLVGIVTTTDLLQYLLEQY